MYLKSQKKKRISLNLYLNIYWMKFSKNNEKQQKTDPRQRVTQEDKEKINVQVSINTGV